MTPPGPFPSPLTASRCRRRSRRTTPFWRWCAIRSASMARGRAAARGCAAAAPSSSTAGRCRAASISPPLPTAQGSRRSSPLTEDGNLDPVQEAFIEHRRVPVRLLHARLRADGQAAARRVSRSGRRSHPRLSRRQSVPLRRLSGNHPGGEGRGAQGGWPADPDRLATAGRVPCHRPRSPRKCRGIACSTAASGTP